MNDDPRAEEIRRLEALVKGAAGALAFPALAEAQRRAGDPEAAERVAREGLERAPHATAGRVALALALIDQKRTGEAVAELERLLGGETEHAIAHDAAASETPEGLDAAASAPIVGELATLDPYPDAYESTAPPSPARSPFAPPPPPTPAEPLVFDASGVRDDELDTAFEEAESDAEQMLGADDVAQAALAAVPDEDEGDAEIDPPPRVDVADGEDEFHAEAGSPFATETVAGLLERQGHAEEAEALRVRISGVDADAFDVEAEDDGALEAEDHAGVALEDEAAPELVDVDAADALREAALDVTHEITGDATHEITGDATHEITGDATHELEVEPVHEDAAAPAAGGGPRNQATLERWLDNLRRDKR